MQLRLMSKRICITVPHQNISFLHLYADYCDEDVVGYDCLYRDVFGKINVCICCYTDNKHNYCTTDSKMIRQLCSEGGAVVMISWNKDST